MKTATTTFLAVIMLTFVAPHMNAQWSFNIQNAFPAEDTYASVSLPAKQLPDIISDNIQGMDDKDVCLHVDPQGNLTGYQADFDGDGSEEMWMLYHAGPEMDGCNVAIMIAPVGGGEYKLYDVMYIPPGKASIHPIKTLSDGMQMYLENEYTLKDGTVETKGSILGYEQNTLLVLTSWTQKDRVMNEEQLYTDIEALFFDVNFDNTKELYLKFSYHDNPKLSEKSIVDQYILTLDFVESNLRYDIYDSIGYDKLQQADDLAKEGLRMLHKESTEMEGIVKIREALETNPFFTFTRIRLGQHLLHDGKYGDAEHTLLDAVAIDPQSEKGWMLLGDTYLRLNNLQKAKAAYDKYLAFNPTGFNARRVKKNYEKITDPSK